MIFIDLFFAAMDFAFRIAYILFAIFCRLVFILFAFILKVLPVVYRAVSGVVSVAIWIVSRLILGLMGCADKATNALSWLMVGCLIYLYIDQNLDMPFLQLPLPVRDMFRQVRRRLVGVEEEEEPDLEDSAERVGLTGRHSTDENCRMERQNLQNENNANAQEEEAASGRRRPRGSNTQPRRPSPSTPPTPSFASSSSSNALRSPGSLPRRAGREEEEEEEEDLMELGASHSSSQISLCSVCLDRERNVAVFPCGHTHLCLPCASAIRHGANTCPTCREGIQDYRIIYL